MTIAELKERVAKAKAVVEKRVNILAKHKALLAKISEAEKPFEYRYKASEIKDAERKLETTRATLAKWISKLSIELEKDRFLNDDAPEVIKEFLNAWKIKAYEWHVKRYEDYLVFLEKLRIEEHEARLEIIRKNPAFMSYRDELGDVKSIYKESRHELINVRPYNVMENCLKEKHLDYRSLNLKKAAFAGAVVMTMTTYLYKEERLAWLEKTLEAEKKAKMLDLINRVNKVVGTILDASYLRIGDDGNLNGYIIGENGKAKVETISAGGWNIQVFHYRTIVKRIK